jgi:hypothetical protein
MPPMRVGCDELLTRPLLEDEDPNGNHRPAEVGASEQSVTGSEQDLGDHHGSRALNTYSIQPP